MSTDQDKDREIAELRERAEKAERELGDYEGALGKLAYTMSELAALRARLEAAEKDTRRLDWLEQQDRRMNAGGFVNIAMPIEATFLNLRSAIDAALTPKP